MYICLGVSQVNIYLNFSRFSVSFSILRISVANQRILGFRMFVELLTCVAQVFNIALAIYGFSLSELFFR